MKKSITRKISMVFPCYRRYRFIKNLSRQIKEMESSMESYCASSDIVVDLSKVISLLKEDYNEKKFWFMKEK